MIDIAKLVGQSLWFGSAHVHILGPGIYAIRQYFQKKWREKWPVHTVYFVRSECEAGFAAIKPSVLKLVQTHHQTYSVHFVRAATSLS
jgi:hypothetical protein